MITGWEVRRSLCGVSEGVAMVAPMIKKLPEMGLAR